MFYLFGLLVLLFLVLAIYYGRHRNLKAITTYKKQKRVYIETVLNSDVCEMIQESDVIPIAASQNPQIAFMVLFSCPTITTLEQLRFQFYTNGNNTFWDNHSQADAREHTFNDPDKYQFLATDPKAMLNKLSIPGLWLFGEKDIQIPAKICIEQLNALKVQGKSFEYSLFANLGHNTAFDNDTTPVDIAIQWIKQHVNRKQ